MSSANDFFNTVDFVSIVDNIKNIYASDASMATLLDFERCLDEADLYAYKNWDLGELVSGPQLKKYSVRCVFMWPYHSMPDPRGCKRLLPLGCTILWKKTKIKIPVKVENYDDFQAGTRYPKMKPYRVWLVSIEMPRELMDEVREGSIDLAGQNIDLTDLDNSYLQDLDKEEQDDQKNEDQDQQAMDPMAMGAPMGAPGAPPII
jgi:hypothetical protein